ncbi:hypothetical protein BAR1_10860 [Profundibacter amoris]|uniref:Uncharacterized protein n=1 Tax=Profundibacter amoris TaxID=2171755 RepID=A0A347UHQ3_9RHOB|nr:hypothetical protein BAR1_10860 [Profundibacter amoris]
MWGHGRGQIRQIAMRAFAQCGHNFVGQQIGLCLGQGLHQSTGRLDRLIIDVLNAARGIVDALKQG